MLSAAIVSTIVLFVFSPFASAISADVVKNLTKQLFETNAYDNTLRPAHDQMSPTDLKVSLYLSSLNKLDELEEKLITTAYLTLEWRDEFLTWDIASFPVPRITIPQNKVWKPDFVLKNGFTEFKELGGSFYNVILSLDGTVFWKPYQVFESQCSIDVTYFPFDTQTCEIEFTLWSHFGFQVTLNSSSTNIEMTRYKTNNVWDITSTSQSIDNTGPSSTVTYSLNLKRKPDFYVGNLVMPILFLGILNLLVFVIPADAGEKMSYCITVALGFIVFLTIISTALPANSDNTPYLSTYLQIQIILGGIALVVSAIQLRLNHKPEYQEVYKPLKVLVKLSMCKYFKAREEPDSNKVIPIDGVQEKNLDANKEQISWNDASSAIDFVMFWIYVFVYCISTIAVMAVLIN